MEYIEVERKNEICHEELVHAILEVEKSNNTRSSSGLRRKKADDAV